VPFDPRQCAHYDRIGSFASAGLCITLSWERVIRLDNIIDLSMVHVVRTSAVHILWWDWAVRLDISIKYSYGIVRNIWQKASVSVNFPDFNFDDVSGEVHYIYTPIEEVTTNWERDFIIERRIIPRIYTCYFVYLCCLTSVYFLLYLIYWTTSKCRCRSLVTTFLGLTRYLLATRWFTYSCYISALIV